MLLVGRAGIHHGLARHIVGCTLAVRRHSIVVEAAGMVVAAADNLPGHTSSGADTVDIGLGFEGDIAGHIGCTGRRGLTWCFVVFVGRRR